MYKRLEKSKFKFPGVEKTKFVISGEQLQWLLSGLDVIKIPEKKSLKVTNFFKKIFEKKQRKSSKT